MDSQGGDDGAAWSEFFREYAQHQAKRNPAAQRRAMALFRSFLDSQQRATLRHRGFVCVVTASGTAYRVNPRRGTTHRAGQHGTRVYGTTAYCYHDATHELPKADVALAHMLLLLADEGAFLRAANATPRRSQWDGAWRRKLNASRHAV